MDLRERVSSLGDCKEVESIADYNVMNCIYCGRPINTAKEGYSIFKNQNGITAWHYICYGRDHTEVLTMSHKTKVLLAKYLLGNKFRGVFEPWMGKVLDSCGYSYD